jgi:aspartate racemase
MTDKIVGVLGGMGPEATANCYREIIRATQARRDQDHVRVLIDSNAKIPDRTKAILGAGPSPVPALRESALLLAQAGADFVIIPCVSAHAFLDEVRAAVDVPILSMCDVVAEAVERERPAIRTVGLLATSGTVRGGFFQERLHASGVATLVPDGGEQERVMAVIYGIKDEAAKRPRAALTAELVTVAGELVARGAQAIVAGCTEIPIALAQEHLRVPYFDSVRVLARAAVVRAGGRLTDLSSHPG